MTCHATLTKLSIVVFMLLTTGCAGTPIHLGAINQKIDKADFDFSKGRTITGSSSGMQLFLFIPLSVNSRHEYAFEELQEEAAGDYVTDIKVQERWKYAFVGTKYETRLKATAYPKKTIDPNETVFWQSIKDSNDPAMFEAYLEQYPNGTFSSIAIIKLKQFEN
jgi:hypothetical protein